MDTTNNLLWELDVRYHIMRKFSFKENKTQYRYDEDGRTKILQKENFINGIYHDSFRHVYYGFDKAETLKKAIEDSKKQKAELEVEITRMEKFLNKIQNENMDIV